MPQAEKFTPRETHKKEKKNKTEKLDKIKKIIKNESHDFVKRSDKFREEMKEAGISIEKINKIDNIAKELDKQENYLLRAKHDLEDDEFAQQIQAKITKLKEKLDEIGVRPEKDKEDNEAEKKLAKFNNLIDKIEQKNIGTFFIKKRKEEILRKYEGEKKKEELESLIRDLEKIEESITKKEKNLQSPKEAFDWIKKRYEQGKGKFSRDSLNIDEQILNDFIDNGLLVTNEQQGVVPEDEIWVYGTVFEQNNSYQEAIDQLKEGQKGSAETSAEEENKTTEEEKDKKQEGSSVEQEKTEKEKVKELFTPKEANFFVQGIDKASYGDYQESNYDTEEPKEMLEKARSVTVGDVHGSARKVLEAAILSDMAAMDEEAAEKFNELYYDLIFLGNKTSASYPEGGDNLALDSDNENTPFKGDEEGEKTSLSEGDERLTAKQKKEKFKEKQEEILEVIENNLEWTGEDRELILIGDVISDRGLSDAITMKIIEKLRENNSENVTICMSDHDWHLLADLAEAQTSLKIPDTKPVHPTQTLSQVRGVSTLEESENPLRVSNKENRENYYSYWKNTKLLHFDESTDTLYAHTNITPEHLEKLKDIINFDEDVNEHNISEFIEQANDWLQEVITSIVEGENINEDHVKFLADLLWTREGDYITEDQLPLKGVVKNFVHGHGEGGPFNEQRSPFRVDNVNSNYSNKSVGNKYKYRDDYNIFNVDDGYRKAESKSGVQEIRKGDVLEIDFKFFVTMDEDAEEEQQSTKKAA